VRTRWSAINNKTGLLEGIILVVSLPLLLFPDKFIPGTLLAFAGLIFIETIPPLRKWRPIQTPSPIDIPLLLFTLVLGLSIRITADPDLTLNKASGLLLGIFLLRYLNRTIKQTKQWHIALGLFGLLGLGFVSLGVLNASWLNKIDLLTPIIARLPNQIVAIPGQASEGIHPNQIAGTILFYFPLLWSVLLGRKWHKSRWQKWLWLGLTLLGTAVLILTQSRSGWLGGIGALSTLLLLWTLSVPRGSRQQRQLLILLGLLIMGGIVTLGLIGPERLISLWQDPAQETAVGSLSSLSFRQEVWRWTIVAIQDFPFTGIGLGSFRRVIRRLYPLGVTHGYVVAHAHNIYLHTAVDIGLPGLIIYLALLGLVIYLGWLAAQRSKPLRPYALGLIAGVIGFHIYGIGDVLALGSKTALSFWFLLGLITTLHQITQPQKKPDQQKANRT
jgi:O-antigen ligase